MAAVEVTVETLSSWLSSQEENTPDTAYDINLTNVDNTNITNIKTALQANPTKYVDLSPTYITSFPTVLSEMFMNCTTLVEGPRFQTVSFVPLYMTRTYKGCTSLTHGVIESWTRDAEECFMGCTSLTSVDGVGSLYLKDLTRTFKGCTSLSQVIMPSNVTTLEYTFEDCISLVSVGTIPSTVTNIKGAFKGCTSLDRVNSETFSAQDYTDTFKGCTSLSVTPTIYNSATNMTSTFEGCTSLTEAPVIPSGVTSMDSTFKGCTGITAAPSFPYSIQNINNCYEGCIGITEITSVPSTVTKGKGAFKNCAALQRIRYFGIAEGTLVNNTNFQNMFEGCESLTSIGFTVTQSDEWHFFLLDFREFTSSRGWLYATVINPDKTTTQRASFSYAPTDLVLLTLTDELWFVPSGKTDEEIKQLIDNVIDTKLSYFNQEVLDPTKRTFFMFADDPDSLMTNLALGGGITVYDTEEELEEDLPNLSDGDIVGTYGDGEPTFNDAPLGSTMSYLGNTDPSDGKWLICDGRDTTGTAIELETHYPNLFMFLGGTNVLPELFDHSRLGDQETFTIGKGAENAVIAPYDGEIRVSRNGNANTLYLYVNGVVLDQLGISTSWNGSVRVQVKKGDSIYYTRDNYDANNFYARWYKHHKIIKATSYVDYYHAPATEIAQIEQYFDNGLQNAESYSTTETLTGGKWIDGKPIYRRVLDNGSWVSNLSIDVSSFNIDTLVHLDILGRQYNNNTGSKWVISTMDYRQAYISGSNILTTSGDEYKRYAIIEYTKTTD